MDLWAAEEWLTCDDNMAFAGQFRRGVLDTAAWLRTGQGSPLPFDGLSPQSTHRRLLRNAGTDDETEAEYELRTRFRALTWGPTTDNVIAHLFRDADRLLLTVQFWREEHLIKHPEDAGKVLVAEIPTVEFVTVLEDLAVVLAGGAR
ncbi:hypothetical protein [Streptacidiphilus rugosus]|uniref:hypothetical protein n=1 Tax=Streptacidiphilus rugosus TaxID=405783 RepID=UPI001E33CAF8|nr:hypothetical protein [Streptacidiphilus rugosus]